MLSRRTIFSRTFADMSAANMCVQTWQKGERVWRVSPQALQLQQMACLKQLDHAVPGVNPMFVCLFVLLFREQLSHCADGHSSQM